MFKLKNNKKEVTTEILSKTMPLDQVWKAYDDKIAENKRREEADKTFLRVAVMGFIFLIIAVIWNLYIFVLK